jgi:hypothetical protein
MARTEALPEVKKPKKARKVVQTDSEQVLGVQMLRVDPDEDFSDVDGDPKNEFSIENEDPQRHYHWAHNNPNDIGQYKGGILKYRVEHYEEGGVFARMNSEQTLGEAITKRDHVLVSCDKALWQKRNRYERVQTLATNEGMIKKLRRDIVLHADDEARA